MKVLTRLRKKNSLLNATAKFLSVQGPGRLGGPVRKLLAISMTTGTTSSQSTTITTTVRSSRFNLNFKKKSPFRAVSGIVNSV